MKRNFFYLVVICSIAALLYLFAQEEDSIAPDDLKEHGKLSSLSLVDQKDSPFTLDTVRDKILVINFFFTSCQGPCPMMSQRMAELQESFLNTPEVALLSVTIDPENDVPEVLLQYGEKYNAVYGKWYFLTGKEEALTSLAEDQLKVGMGEHAELHTTKFILIDQKTAIRGYYDSYNDKDMARLKKDVQRLRHNPPIS